MRVYTIQLAQHRKAAERGIQLIDTTVKSGVAAFAPNWKMVRESKAGVLSEKEYEQQYRALIEHKKIIYPLEWEALCNTAVFALGCYCRAGKFCHRHILKDIIEEECAKRDIDFVDGGEIE